MPARFALAGRVVTMNEHNEVLDRGIVYLEDGRIIAVAATGSTPPPGFASIHPIATAGTIYPGLIELHNHLSYDALPLWRVPKKYGNRGQWGRAASYAASVTGPMHVLAGSAAMPALIRYVEVKALVAGVTTSQGISLASDASARRYYHGLVRNVEQTDEAELPEADTRIADVDASSWASFNKRVHGRKQLLLHLAEGRDESARKHFLSLRNSHGSWAITPRLIGIHCAALTAADFNVMRSHGAAMVWSPLSNLLLYGESADIVSARAEGVPIALGSDWSPSGSKNLLCELKVARVVAPASVRDRDIVAMATCDAAAIIGWQSVVGSIAPTRHGDLIVCRGTSGDPYAQLLEANEEDIELVVIAGVPRIGTKTFMQALGVAGETIRVGHATRRVNLVDPISDPLVTGLSLNVARERISQALHDLPRLARAQERAAAHPRARAGAAPTWRLALDETEPTGMEVRPRIGTGAAAGPAAVSPLAATNPLSKTLQPMKLDPLTVVDDDDLMELLAQETNLPQGLAAQIASWY